MLGYEAVNALLDGQRGVMVGIINNKVAFTPFERAIKHHKDIDLQLLEMSPFWLCNKLRLSLWIQIYAMPMCCFLCRFSAYTYSIPDGLASSIVEGGRVVVQFGKKKIYTALVIEIHDRKPIGHEAKEILSVLDEVPVSSHCN